MTTYEIWMEGYEVSGNRSVAVKIGESEGVDFVGAVLSYMAIHPEAREDFKFTQGRAGPTNLSIWGCRLFPTAAEARASFG